MIHYTSPIQQGLGRPMPPRTRAPIELDADGVPWCPGCDLPLERHKPYRGALCMCEGRHASAGRRRAHGRWKKHEHP